ncbi:MAG TPA: electron transfer flavoprotein subunit beta/FixA family protein [Anaerolineaceae bacterium]|jgi:electron transfer flavoprotein beta subunit|nr:electron transfer flavoprotein subunit beta/FixA family protein [Anaerolineaceae bacterium]
MDILVCIKQVPGTSAVKIDEKTGSLMREGIDSKMNPYDLYALETAFQIDQRTDAHITVLSMGPSPVREIIQEAFLMGDADGVILTDRRLAGADCLATAYAISQCIEKIGLPDLIICGKQTTDGDTAQVGAEIAEFLHIPHITNVLKIEEIKTESLIVEADLPAMTQRAEIRFPALITVEKGIYQPRLPSFKRKQRINDQKIQVYSVQDLADQNEAHYGLSGSPTQVLRIFPPETEITSELWKDSAQDLAQKFYDILVERKFI